MNSIQLCFVALIGVVAFSSALPVHGRLRGNSGDLDIPVRSYGVNYGHESAKVTIELFGDFQCPDTKAVYPIIKDVVDDLGEEKVRLLFQPFPLPYHYNSFRSAMAAHTVLLMDGHKTYFDMADVLFSYQDSFQNAPTANMTETEKTDMFFSFAAKAGITDKDTFVSLYNDPTHNNEVRLNWKFGCYRGVFGTPTVFVNGVDISNTFSLSWTVKDWKALLDPLL